MIQINVKNLSGATINSTVKDTQELAEAWVAEQEGVKAFGNVAYDDDMQVHHGAEYTIEYSDITYQYELDKEMNECEASGELAEKLTFGCLRIVAGYNNKRVLSYDQIVAMGTAFASVETLLVRRMPKSSKAAITAISPDGVLLTQRLKDLLLNKLKDV